MRLLFLHGWGLDASLWDDVRALLPGCETIVWDRGYFGSPMTEPPSAPFIAVGHSLGAMLLAGMEGAAGLIAVNGFDRFAGEDAVPPRVVGRMRKRFAEAPAEVLGDFRARIGAEPASGRIEADRLSADLELLATTHPRHCEERSDAAIHTRSARGSELLRSTRNDEQRATLVLHGGADPLLPEIMRETVFAGAPRETLAEAGHLLPLTHPHWVAERIRAFAA